MWEGLRLLADDRDGTWTCGYGHTRGVKQGTTCTREQALAWLDEDLAESVRNVTVILSSILTGYTQGQFDALVSFCFNFGATKLNKSSLMFHMRLGEPAGDELLRWCHDKHGNIVPGLLSRRKHEREWFNE